MTHSLRAESRVPSQDAAALLAVASRLAAAAESSDEAASILAESIVTLLSAEGCLVSSLEDGYFRVDAAAGCLSPIRGERNRVDESLALRTLQEARVIVVNDVTDDAAINTPFHAELGIRQVASAPLIAGGVAFGVLLAVNSGRGDFSDDDAVILQRVAELGSPAVRNARLLERERRSAREARALTDIVRHLNQSLEVERVFTLIAEHAADLLQGAGATVTMVDGESLRIVGAAGHAIGRFAGVLPTEGVFSGEALRRRRPVRTADLRLFPRWEQSDELLNDVAPNAVAAPLLVGDRAIGTVLVYGNPRRDFNEHEEELLQALASHAAVAVENARLYRAAARTTRHAEILAATGRTLASAVSSESVFDGIERVATELLGADGFTVYSIDVERRTAAVQHARGLGTEQVASIAPKLWVGRPGWAVENAENVILPDLQNLKDEELSEPLAGLRAAGVKSIAFLPLVADGVVRGLLVMRWLNPRHADEAEYELLTDFATHVAIALRNADLLEDLERRATRLAAVAQVQQAISRTELGEVYGEVHRAALSSIPRISVFALLLANAEHTQFLPQLIVVDGVSTGASALPSVPVGDCGASLALRDGGTHMSDAPARPWSDPVAGRSGRPPVHAEIAVPILHGEEILGVLVVQGDEARVFDDDDAAVLSLIARQAGAAIENARLFEAERQARSVAEAAASIARAALFSNSAQESGRLILAAVDSVVPSTGKALGLMGDSGETITYVSAIGTLAPLQDRVIPGRESAARLVGTRGAVLTPPLDVLASIQERDVVPAGASVVPLIAKDQLLGVLWSVPVAGARVRREQGESLGRLAAHVALAADVLLLGEEERKRRERERMLATALATMDQPVFILGLDRRVWYANAAAGREYGYSGEEIGAITFDTLVASAVPARRLGNGNLSTSSVWMAEHVHRRRDGSEFPASVMLSYIRDDAGAPVGQVMNVRNLTDERRIEEQLRQSEKLAALGELVAGVAHELNNPLAGISAFAQLLLEEKITDEQRESVRLIKREADRAVGVIRDLLIFSRKPGPTRSPIDLNEIIELTLRLRNYSLRSADVEVQVDLAPGLPRVRGDDQRLQQVLLNLIVNAEYAMQRSSIKQLGIRTEPLDQGVLLTIADTGSGMAEETRQRIFEPFFTTKPAGQGTGLGLSVSYGIVQAHGGSISVESQLGSGSLFRIYLPASGAPAPSSLSS
ncbi:MAG: GAF domain-containing protein [Gemmatimonadetes bacterium]|nr:GAF domain-containing protein [Gemmatimonadota bacterium]MCC7323037.1 GAF domain-containing protein [Gemmatimonadaceae bacterium]MBK6843063.1 GAF domain-containing protein [Gemmatimonadota bacterium]MBK7831530.1 GAF domain-containing protein [Gemmatimonadota bacterium]MBK8059695.1 GAF domain-containing protein [Gemmatimonadota bacterium]